MASQKGIGRLIQVGVAKETTRGTAISSATFWNPWMDLTLDEKKEFAIDEQSYGIIEDTTNLTQTKRWAQGSIAGNVADTTIGLILYALFGGYSVTGSGPYVHTFSVAESAQHQSLTLFLHDPLSAVDYSYANGIVEKLEISAELKKFINFNASIMAKTGASQSAFSPSTTSEGRFVPQYITANFAIDSGGLAGTKTATGTCSTTIHVTALSISTTLLRIGMTVTGSNIPAGATIAKIVSSTAFDLSAASTGSATSYTFGPAVIALKSAKVTINANVESQDVLGSLDPADFLNKEFGVEGTIEAIWQNESDFKTPFMGPTTESMSLAIANGASSGLTLTFYKVQLQELNRPFKVKDLVYQTIKFKAVYSTADTSMVTAVLTNSTSTY